MARRAARQRQEGREKSGQFGDCIDCLSVVAVGPTGIDIREVPQVAVITCALFIDACDPVWRGRSAARLNRLRHSRRMREGGDGEATRSPWRPSSASYCGLLLIWGSIGLAMLFALASAVTWGSRGRPTATRPTS